jgi:hypothetical protein
MSLLNANMNGDTSLSKKLRLWEKSALSAGLIAASIWTVLNIGRSNEIPKSKTGYLWGCYDIKGRSAFRLTRDALFSGGSNFGFKVVQRKADTALEFDRPVQVVWQSTRPGVVYAGTASFASIDRSANTRLSFLGADHREFIAEKGDCSGA